MENKQTITERTESLSEFIFNKHVPGLGDFHLRHLHMPDDIPLIHGWVTREYAKYWGMQGSSIEEVEAAYIKILEHSRVFLGIYDGKPVFLLECYRAMEDQVGKFYDVQPGDYGMHILVAPPNQPISNFTWHVFTVLMELHVQ